MKREALPTKKSQECDKLVRTLLKNVDKTRELVESIEEGRGVVQDIKLMESEGHSLPFPEGEGNAVQAYEDYLALAKDQLQMLREAFQTKLAELPDDVRKKIEKRLSVQEIDRLYGNSDSEEQIDDSVDNSLIDDSIDDDVANDQTEDREYGHFEEASANA